MSANSVTRTGNVRIIFLRLYHKSQISQDPVPTQIFYGDLMLFKIQDSINTMMIRYTSLRSTDCRSNRDSNYVSILLFVVMEDRPTPPTYVSHPPTSTFRSCSHRTLPSVKFQMETISLGLTLYRLCLLDLNKTPSE